MNTEKTYGIDTLLALMAARTSVRPALFRSANGPFQDDPLKGFVVGDPGKENMVVFAQGAMRVTPAWVAQNEVPREPTDVTQEAWVEQMQAQTDQRKRSFKENPELWARKKKP